MAGEQQEKCGKVREDKKRTVKIREREKQRREAGLEKNLKENKERKTDGNRMMSFRVTCFTLSLSRRLYHYITVI